MNKSEDKSLVELYSREDLLTPINGGKALPILSLVHRRRSDPRFKIIIDDSTRQYSLPSVLDERVEGQLRGFKDSVVYNQMMIRLDDLTLEGLNSVLLSTSRTTYFNTLVTNRSADFRPSLDLLSVREIFEPGPFITFLKDSQMSNHLGYNGVIKLSDDQIVLVKRSRYLSTAKSSLGSSVSASLKVSQALDDDQSLSMNGVTSAIISETLDELGVVLKEEDVEIFAFYRDLIEVGKPQFLFYSEIDLDEEEFLKVQRLVKEERVESSMRDKVLVDGEEFVFWKVEELQDILRSTGDELLPNLEASLILLIDFLGLKRLCDRL